MAELTPMEKSLARLREGNEMYLAYGRSDGNVTAAMRLRTAKEGQKPFATILTCSDSRVIPEVIFGCGIGDIFTIRVAGNVVDPHQLGSIEYAASHLGTPVTVVLGHTHCGAVAAAMEGHADGYIGSITQEIQQAIGDTTDAYEACARNVRYNAKKIQEAFVAHHELKEHVVVGAVYDIASGRVEWLF